MSDKVRRIDFHPDEYIAGVAGQLTAEEQGVYWMICALIASHGGPVQYDLKRFAALLLTRPAHVDKLISSLVTKGKLTRNGDELCQKRMQSVVEVAAKRIQNARENGEKGGRPSNNNNELSKAPGLNSEKLTINHQPSTNNQKEKDTRADARIDGFEDFYREFPKHVGRGAALKAYRVALKKPGVTQETLVSGAKRYAGDPNRKPEFTAHPASWLNAERWADEAESPSGAVESPEDRAKKAAETKAIREAVERSAKKHADKRAAEFGVSPAASLQRPSAA